MAGGFSYRAFGKYLDHGQSPASGDGEGSGDGWHLMHGGFRLDGDLSAADSLTVEGDFYRGLEGAEVTHSVLAPAENCAVQRRAGLTRGNVLGRWNHIFDHGSDSTLQMYLDNSTRNGRSR